MLKESDQSGRFDNKQSLQVIFYPEDNEYRKQNQMKERMSLGNKKHNRQQKNDKTLENSGKQSQLKKSGIQSQSKMMKKGIKQDQKRMHLRPSERLKS